MSIRSTAQRVADVRAKLENEVDIWVSSASATGDSYVLPLSFYWDGASLTIATPRKSRTARNLRRAGWARLALGPTRDVVILEGPVQEVAVDADDALAEAHACAAGFDARDDPGYVFIQVKPNRIQTWRNPAELAHRDVMRDGEWLA
ncbi:MAG TPA: pyridoxamine 5'-phosphate oxidase family protein [Nitrolancea sp.]|nr:pyridoxamine 5'-phosphate oxidase family protein [Nitrolancea sp.]